MSKKTFAMINPADIDTESATCLEELGQEEEECCQYKPNEGYQGLPIYPSVLKKGSIRSLYCSGNLRGIKVRKGPEKVLQAREAAMRGILDATQESVWLFGANGQVLLANRKALERFGKPQSDVIGKSVIDINPQHLGAERMERIQQVIRSGCPLEFDDKRADILFHHNLYPVFDGGGQVSAVACYSQDITEKKRVEEEHAQLLAEVKTKAAELDATISSIATALIVYDMTGKVIQLNKAAEKLFPPEFVFTNTLENRQEILRWETEDGRPLLLEEMPVMRALRGETTQNVVLGAQFPDHKLWISACAAPIRTSDGKMLGAVASFFDITSQKRVEANLRQSEALYRGIGETIDYGVWVCAPDGRNIYASESFLRMAGITQEECSNFGWGKILHPEDAESTINAWKECVRTEDKWDIEHRFLGADGQWHPVLARGVPIRNSHGEVSCWAGINLDISALKRVEKALRDSEEMLEQRVAERTSALERANLTLTMITECNHALVHIQDERELAQQICSIIRRIGGYVMVWVGYAESDTAKTVLPIAWDGVDDGYLQQTRITWADEPQGWGPTGSCIRLRGTRLNRDFETEPDLAPWRNNALRCGFRSSLAVSIIWQEQVYGALTLYSERPDGFDPDQVAQLAELAKDLAFGITSIRSRLERDEARHVAEHRMDRLRTLSIELIQAEQRERQKLAQILHDHLQQLLVAAKLGLEGLSSKIPDESSRKIFCRLEDILVKAIQASRSLATELSPSVFREKGLLAAVKWLSNQMLERYGLTIEVIADEDNFYLGEQTFTFLFEAIRELLFNVVKHAGVDKVQLKLASVDGMVEITLEDHGVGYDLTEKETSSDNESGLGLFSIQERIIYLGGRMLVESAPGQGCRILLITPTGVTPAPLIPAEIHNRANKGISTGTPGATSGETIPELATFPTMSPLTMGGINKKIRVILADDHSAVLQSLANVIKEHPDLEVLAEAHNGEEAVELVLKLQPDVVLMDIDMPKMNGIEATKLISRNMPIVAVIGLTMHNDQQLWNALRQAGALDTLPKGVPSEQLISVIRACSGRRLNSPRSETCGEMVSGNS